MGAVPGWADQRRVIGGWAQRTQPTVATHGTASSPTSVASMNGSAKKNTAASCEDVHLGCTCPSAAAASPSPPPSPPQPRTVTVAARRLRTTSGRQAASSDRRISRPLGVSVQNRRWNKGGSQAPGFRLPTS